MGQGGQWPLKLDCRTCIEPQDNHTLAGKASAAIRTGKIRLRRQSDATGSHVVHESTATKECETGDDPLPRRSETRYSMNLYCRPLASTENAPKPSTINPDVPTLKK